MEIKAYFSNIHHVIIEHLETAQTEIAIAVAWFTDRDIFEVLCKKARLGVKVSLVLNDDDINRRTGGLNFYRLRNFGGLVVFLASDTTLMHHKFCVIDHSCVITGSYNWSQKARGNDENVTIMTEAQDLAADFLTTFEELLARAGQAKDTPALVDTEALRRRIELIRNLVLLGEQDEITPHLRKLRSATTVPGINGIIQALDKGEYKAAVIQINEFLHRVTALVSVDQDTIVRLRFELRVLELRLESLSDEKAELERRLLTFNRRHDEALGDLIQRVLRARAELARLAAANQKKASPQQQQEAQAKAEEAEKTYSDYAKHHEELLNEEPLPTLSEADEKQLKTLYRKASKLCHPDMVPDAQKEAAHHAFIELQAAYQSNDVPRVREIHATLAAGGLVETRSNTLSEVDTLKTAIAELAHTIERLSTELTALHQSPAMRRMDSAGATETDWQDFFTRQSEILDQELINVAAQIQVASSDEDSTFK
ncbi:MAG: phospholipase D-like domain-containing protein [Pseudomonadales bacterium]|jgi:hypothetical protein|nr:phospholipase D-like domain-containing protein [Pseudomonadales bacterium]